MEECLDYFRQALEHPGTVPPWADWWASHSELVCQAFERVDYLRLKYRWLAAAREILDRHRQPAVEPKTHVLDRTVCPTCGERLIKFVPGTDPSYEERLAFVRRSGRDADPNKLWFHHGVYCPFGCTCVMIEFRTPATDTMWAKFDAKYMRGQTS
jgi:hypothetical protein